MTLGIEREVYRNTSVGLQYVNKETDKLFDSTCAGNIPTPTQGGDCSYKVIANLGVLQRDYEGWIVNFETRAWKNAHIIASYVYSDSKGSIGWNQYANPDFDVYPQNWVNRYGYLENHRQHQVKINGYWLLPHRFTFGFGFNWTSGFPWTPKDLVSTGGVGEEFLEPRGSREGEDYSQLDVQLSKAVRLGGSFDMELIASILNLGDTEGGLAVCENVNGCAGGVAMGQPTAWQLPRRYELGLRLTL
jgi:hypothetical protein